MKNSEVRREVAAKMVERYARRAQLADNAADREYFRKMAESARELLNA